ncbi:unnamed protein product, partial [marine sediment metagenome]
MPSNLHKSILIKAINEYFDRGYKLIGLDSNLTDNYRPDAVMENNEEIVVIEAIVTSESTKSVEDIQPLFSKTIRIDKRRMKPERTKISRSAEETKSMVLKVFQEAYPQDLYIVEASMKAGVSDPTGAMYIRILEAEGKV